MDFSQYTLTLVEAFLLVFFRVAALVAFAPVLGDQNVPKRVKIGLALVIAGVVFPLVAIPAAELPRTILAFGVAVAREVLIGLAAGYAIQIIFAGVQTAGQIVGFQMGFGIVNVIDPQSNLQVSIIGHFLGLLALMLFLALNGHHAVLRIMDMSFRVVPLGQAQLTGLVWSKLLRMSGDLFAIAVKLGAPMIAILVLTKVALGLVARTVPQMNVFIVGFPLGIAIGLLSIGVSLPLFGLVFRHMLESGSRDIVFLVHHMH